jgi:outer membrane protein TolC
VSRPDLPPVEDALRAAYETNPALVALVEDQQRLEDTAAALARGRLPRLEGGGLVDWQSSDVLEPQGIGAGFVGFRWDLGTDGRREAQIAEAKIQAERNRLAIEQELRELESAIRRNHRAVEERLAALAAAEAAVGQAEENLRIRTQQFDVGRATSEDVLDAEALLAEQRATLATALYQAHTRRAELQQLMGLPLDALARR